MPELPDAEQFRKYLEEHALGRTIVETRVLAPRILERMDAETFRRETEGKRFQGTSRYGKYLLAPLSGGPWVVFHFGMTGYLAAYGATDEPPSHPRVVFRFDDGGFLAYDNRRMIGRIMLTPGPDFFVRERGLGPDALDAGVELFRRTISGHQGRIKPLLMDQTFIAGVGNVYADAALFAAGIDPALRASDLTPAMIDRLHRETIRVLREALRYDADPDRMPDDLFLPRRRRGGACPRCDRPLRTEKLAGRTTYSCSACQPRD